MSLVKIDHYDSYRDDDIQVVIRADGQITIQVGGSSVFGGGQMLQIDLQAFQRVINIVTMHNQISKRKGV